jgi:hypothetical protein
VGAAAGSPALMQVKPRPARGAKLTIPDYGAE